MLKKQLTPILLLLLVLMFTPGCKQANQLGNTEETTETAADPSTYFYGINVDSLDIHQEKIERNAFLANILLAHDVNYSTIHEITESSEGVFDFRKLRMGQNYYILHSKDSLKIPEYFIYDKNLSEYTVKNAL